MNAPGRDATAFDRRAVVSWCSYDWANSPFPAIVLTFVFPAYFTQAVAADIDLATSQWAFMTGASALVIALVSPLLGAIADRGRGRKAWLAGCTAVMAVASGSLWFATPDMSSTALVLWAVAIGVIAFEIGAVFLNSFLPGLVPDSWLGRISGWAWGLGYAGGLCGMLLVLFGFVLAEEPLLGLDKGAAEHVRIAGPVVGLWLAVFCLPLFLWTSDRSGSGLPAGQAIREGTATMWRSLLGLPRNRVLGRFLLARMLYTDGINTLFAFGGIYAAGTFGMTVDQVILFGLLLNLTAGLGSGAFGWLDDRIGAKATILLGLTGIVLTGIPILLISDPMLFWVLGAVLGIFFGPVQSASRSLMARITPPGRESEMFGLYALSGRITAFVGPWLVGAVVLATASQRIGLATVLPFLILGGVLLYRIDLGRAGGERSGMPERAG